MSPSPRGEPIARMPTSTLDAITVRVVSGCGGPLAGSMAGFAEAVAQSNPAAAQTIAHVVAGPSSSDGILTISKADVVEHAGEPLLVSAPNHETSPLDLAALASGTGPGIPDVTLEKETTIVGEITWPPHWQGHVKPLHVAAGVAPDDPKAQWTARGLPLADEGRSFRGTVKGCGRFRVVCGYRLDDDESSLAVTVEIGVQSGPEVHVSMAPGLEAKDLDTSQRARWVTAVSDDQGTPLEGATVTAIRRRLRSWGPLPDPWETDRAGEAVRDVQAGEYLYTVRKPGWGTVVARVTVSGDRRDAVSLVPARATLALEYTRTPTIDVTEVTFLELRVLDPASGWPWTPLEQRATARMSARLEFQVVDGHDYAVLASGDGLAPAAERVRVDAGVMTAKIALSMDRGESVEVRGLESAPHADPVPLQIQPEGLLGEMMTITGEARFRDGKWWIDHVGKAAGSVKAMVSDRTLRGPLPPAGGPARVVEVR